MIWKIIQKADIEEMSQMDAFIRSHPKGHFMQLPQWSKVKTCWGWNGIMVWDRDQIVAAMSVLIRPLPLGFSLLYAPRGPVCDRSAPEVWESLLEALKEIAGQHRAVLLYLDPDEPDANEDFRTLLKSLGFREKEDRGFGNIQPQFVFRLDLSPGETALYNAFSQKTRYNIRLAQRRGVMVREYSGMEAIPDRVLEQFSRLMETTGQRDHFQVRGKSYFQGLLPALGDDGRLFMAFYENEPIAGTIEIFCGGKAWYLYGASSNTHRGVMPNYLLQWTMIRRAMGRGCKLYDFRGVPGNPAPEDPLYGLYRFKKGFSGTYTKFTGLFTYRFRPLLGAALEWLIHLKKLLRPKKTK